MLKLLAGLSAGLLIFMLAIPVLLTAAIAGLVGRRRAAAGPVRRGAARGGAVIEAEGRVVDTAAQQD